MLRALTGCRAHLSLIIGGFILITRIKSTWRTKTVEQRFRALLSLIINGFERNWVWTWNGWCWKRLSSLLESDRRWIRAHYKRMKAVERTWVWSETASSTTESGPRMPQAQRFLESDFRRIRAIYERTETIERTWIWSQADLSALESYHRRIWAHLSPILGGVDRVSSVRRLSSALESYHKRDRTPLSLIIIYFERNWVWSKTTSSTT